MSNYEFKVIPAPRKADKIKGVRDHDDRFAQTLTNVINELADDGWEYTRAEALPVDEKVGIMGKSAEKVLNLLVFRRAKHVESILDDVEPETSFETPDAADPSMLTTLTVEDEEAAEITPVGSASRD